MTTSHKLDNDLYLIVQDAPASPAVVSAPKNINHIIVVDCSGSMAGDLPKMREQLKNKLPALLNPGDTFSAVWFSGRSEHGVFIQAAKVEDVRDVQSLAETVDKWLRPIGLTGFKGPLEDVAALIMKVRNSPSPDATVKNRNPWSMLFLSDGGDNQHPRDQVLKALEDTALHLASIAIVEYGYYADRPFLTRMAERCGGQHVFAEDFDRYEPTFTKLLQQRDLSDKKIEVTLEKAGDMIGGIAWTQIDGEIVAYSTADDGTGKIQVPLNTGHVFFLASHPIGEPAKIPLELGTAGMYATLALFSLRGRPNIIWPTLKTLGDVRFIKMFGNCFGKQKYSEFYDQAKLAAGGKGRFTEGLNHDLVPDPNAFTVIDVLKLLASDDKNRVLLDHKDFKYSRIGRARVPNDDALKFAPKFSALGYSVNNLVFNEDQPNISINVRREGTVDLSKETGMPSATKDVPDVFETNIYRNYAIVKDGLVNVDKLPVLLTRASLEAYELGVFTDAMLKTSDLKADLQIDGVDMYQRVIDLRALPVINRQMVDQLKAETFFKAHFEMTVAKAGQKVFGAYYSERHTGAARTSEGLDAKYGTAAAAWLRERGLTDHGFSPRGKTAAVQDFYIGKELKVSLKGLSSLPSVKEAKEKLAKATEKKPAPIGCRLMEPHIKAAEEFIAANKGRDKIIDAWLDGQQVLYRTKARMAMAAAAKDMICVVVGQTWFSDFATIDDNMMKITTAYGPLDCKVEMKEIEIKL